MKVIRDFKDGFFSAFEGLRFLFKHSSLLKLAIIPWIINIALFIGMMVGLYHYFGDIMGLILTKPEEWYWLIGYYLLTVIALVVILVVATFAVCLIGNLIASPFHEWIAEKTKEILRGTPSGESFSWRALWKEAIRILKTQVKKLSLLLTLEVGVLLLILVPVIGTVMSGALTLILLTFQFIDFPLEVERLDFAKQMKSFRTFPFAWLGFGAGISLLLMIPIANLSVLPGGVVGASLLFYRKIQPGI